MLMYGRGCSHPELRFCRSKQNFHYPEEEPMRQVLIFDTTLRDGLKSPGTILTIEEKVRIASQLARLNVDVLEVGFPAASQEQYAVVERVSREISGPIITALARATNPRDFEIAWKTIRASERPRLHTFAPISNEYREHFLKKDAHQAVEISVAAVKTARKYTPDVEFSLVDAFRADPKEVLEMVRSVVDAGATVVNLADTVGRATPSDVAVLFRLLREGIDQFGNVTFSIHCHNDLGMAVSNSLAAVMEGATQVHCTVNGIGERAGNTPLEELVAALSTRSDLFGAESRIHLDQIYPSSRLVRRLTGVNLQPHKPVVGSNAFFYASDVPQFADATDKPPYEIMHPEKLGIQKTGELLSSRTTLAELRNRFEELGYDLSSERLQECYSAFQELAMKKEQIFDADLELLVNTMAVMEPAPFNLLYLKVNAGSISVPNATVQMEVNGEVLQDSGFGHGPVDAAFKTIMKMTRRQPRLVRYSVGAVTPGTDAQGEVSIRIEEGSHLVNGRGADTDIVLASAKALVDALNKLERVREEAVIYEFTDEESWLPKL